MTTIFLPTYDPPPLSPEAWLAQWHDYADRRARELTGQSLGEVGRGQAFVPPWKASKWTRRAKRVVPHKQFKPVASDRGEWWPSRDAAAQAMGVTSATVIQAIRIGCQCRERRLSNGEQPRAKEIA